MVSTRSHRRPNLKRNKKVSTERCYDQQKYWNDRYAAKFNFTRKRSPKTNADVDDHTDEWYFSYSDMSDVLKSYLRKVNRQSPVLDIGCGISRIFDHLSDDNFIGPFLGVDYSPIAVAECKKIKKNNYSYMMFDMMEKSIPSLPMKNFGLIIDKATTDGILCRRENLKRISNLYEHASRLLSSNGIFIIVTIKTVDDSEWFEGCLIPSLIRAETDQAVRFVIHFHRCISYSDGSENGPNIFVIVKHCCKTYSLRSSDKRSEGDLSHAVTIKCY